MHEWMSKIKIVYIVIVIAIVTLGCLLWLCMYGKLCENKKKDEIKVEQHTIDEVQEIQLEISEPENTYKTQIEQVVESL